MLHCLVPLKNCRKHELEIQSKCSFEVLCTQPLLLNSKKEMEKLLLFCTSDDLRSVRLLHYPPGNAVCELEWNRTRCHENQIVGGGGSPDWKIGPVSQSQTWILVKTLSAITQCLISLLLFLFSSVIK